MTIFLLTHSTGIKGPGDFLEDYLLENGNSVLKLQHPLDNYRNKQTIFTKNKKQVSLYNRSKLSVINYIIDFAISLRCILFQQIDIYIGANNFDTIPGIVAKYVFKKKIKKIIYFASDYSEDRFKNKFLDILYLRIEKFALQYADYVISNTQRAANKRISIGLVRSKNIVIPNGIFLQKPQFKNKKIDAGSFIYIGNVTKEHGIFQIIDIFSSYIKRLVIIGQGEEWEKLKVLTEKKNIPSEFYFKKDHDFVIKYLQEFEGFGFAPYNMFSKWTYYSSPIKIVEYISCGVPVITSDVTELAEKVEKDGLGIVYKILDKGSIKKNIDTLKILW